MRAATLFAFEVLKITSSNSNLIQIIEYKFVQCKKSPNDFITSFLR